MKNCLFTLIFLFLITLAGCQSQNKMGINPDSGLPEKDYLVGGGFVVNYTAPCDGTAILTEKTSGKIVQTKSMKKGDLFESPGGIDSQDALKFFGLPLSKLVFQLYFIPDEVVDLVPPSSN